MSNLNKKHNFFKFSYLKKNTKKSENIFSLKSCVFFYVYNHLKIIVFQVVLFSLLCIAYGQYNNRPAYGNYPTYPQNSYYGRPVAILRQYQDSFPDGSYQYG